MTSKAMLQTNQDSDSNDANLHVWPVKRDKKTVEAYWQFTGANKQLAVCLSNDAADADTRTRPCLLDASNDKTQLWDISEWKSNNTSGFISVHNGTKFHLECIPNGPVFMSSDVDDTRYQTRQHWLMTSAPSVTDKAFKSTVSEVRKSPRTLKQLGLTESVGFSSNSSRDNPTSTAGSESSSSNGNIRRFKFEEQVK
ncbi:transmembrane alpha-helix domain-containing protein [Fusarium coicis]|nr:transmembrane alpha-helix domain-containing protein [Fusarium coicis]